MHRLSTTFVLGYHGCTKAIADSLIAGQPFKPSENDYDWLGHGIYFWENDPDRAFEWISEKLVLSFEKPAVVGAVIDLGFCFYVTTQAASKTLKDTHQVFAGMAYLNGDVMPVNDGGPDRLKRNLDCSIVNFIHEVRHQTGETALDTVRGIFIEGQPVYGNPASPKSLAGFYEKTHVQIAVRNQACIKGVFRPR